MTEQVVSENLKRLIKLHDGISLLELSKRTQIPQPTLHHILNGETKKPRKQALEALANFFSISINQLTGANPLPKIPDALKENLKISTVPVIGWEMIKNYSYEKNNETQFKEIILDKQIDVNSFALIMQDASMEPVIPEKSLLIFDAGKKPKDRDFVIALFMQEGLIVFNRLFIDGNEFYIKQNQQGGDAQLRKLIPPNKIIATLIEVRLQF